MTAQERQIIEQLLTALSACRLELGDYVDAVRDNPDCGLISGPEDAEALRLGWEATQAARELLERVPAAPLTTNQVEETI